MTGIRPEETSRNTTSPDNSDTGDSGSTVIATAPGWSTGTTFNCAKAILAPAKEKFLRLSTFLRVKKNAAARI